MRTRAQRSIGISLVAAAAVLGMPASAYALYGPIDFVLSAIGVLALLGLAAFVVFRWDDPEFRHRAGAVSLFAVIGGLLVALVSIPFVVRSDRLTSEAEVQRHCGSRLDSLDTLYEREFGYRDFDVTVSEAQAAGLAVPEPHRWSVSGEPITTSLEDHFELRADRVGGRWIGWYPVEPVRGRFMLLAFTREPRDRAEVLRLVERHEVVSARWVRAIGDTIAIHRGEAGGTLELRDASLTILASASEVGQALELLDDGAGGGYALAYENADRLFSHIAADGRTRRFKLQHRIVGHAGLYSQHGDGFCFRIHGGMMRVEGDPLRPVTFDLATIARDNQSLLLALLGGLLSLAVGFAFLRRHLRLVLAHRRAPLVGGLRTLGDRTRVLIDERGEEHPIERIDAFVGFDSATDSDDEPCTALGVTSLGADGGPYRGAPARLVLRVVIAGTLDEARALARGRLLDRMSYVGLALLVTAGPCLVIAFGLLFAA